MREIDEVHHPPDQGQPGREQGIDGSEQETADDDLHEKHGALSNSCPMDRQPTLPAASGNAACYFQPFIGHSSFISADFSGQTSL